MELLYKKRKERVRAFFYGALLVFGGFFLLPIAFAVNLTSQVIVGNALPTVSGVAVNAGANITLTTNATTAIAVNATVTDNNGCSDILNGSSTILLYRSGITSSTCMTGANNANCYLATAFTSTSSCQSSVTINTTTTFGVYYFANATDASSSFNANTWLATVVARDGSNSTGTADLATGVEVLTLTGINVTTSSVNYGSLSANSDTGAVNQMTTSTNAGNSSTTLQLSAQSTLTSGANSISTSSQHYSTSTFTYAGTSTALTAVAVTVPGFLLTAPTSTNNVQQVVFWGLAVPSGAATGTYTGTSVFTSLFQP